MSLYPFPTNVYRVFPETDVEAVKRDDHGLPTAVCITAHTTGDRAIALTLLKESPASFVLSEGVRYLPEGTLHPCDPALPASITELRRAFDVETVTFEWPGPRPRVYIFTYCQQEWEQAKSAVRHLLDLKLLSPRSYIEGELNGEAQGLSAQNLDAKPHSAGWVALIREAAYCVQNDLYEKEDCGEDFEDKEWQEDEEEYEEDDEEEYEEDDEEFQQDFERVEERWLDEEDSKHASAEKLYGRVTAWFTQTVAHLYPGH